MATDVSNFTHVPIDHDAVLRAVGLNVRDPSAQALLLTCQRYGLDPVLKHMCLIQNRPYVTRDGLLHVAHMSGKFDGITVEEIGENSTHYTAKVSVFRKDMSRPFTYPGRYPKSGPNRAFGPEMAIKVAECMALRRAFNVALCAREEVWETDIESSAEEGRREINEASIPPRKVSDQRSLHQLVMDGVDKVNAEFASEHEGAEAIVSVFEVQRHLLKAAIAENQIPDPGKVAQGRCHVILARHYETKEGRQWLRRELADYLASRLEEARHKAVEAPEEPEYESPEVEAVMAEAREPGEDG